MAAAAPSRLLGPPFIHVDRPPPNAGPSSHPFLELLDAGFNSPGPEAVRDRRIGALGSNPCLDFFFQVLPGTPPQRVRDLLAAAWVYDPLTALKLVCNLRDVRGTGKSDMESFYTAALWMHDEHPRTLACNIPALAEFGYLKDFPELLFRLIHGADVRTKSKSTAAAAASVKAQTKAAVAAAATLSVHKRKRRRGAETTTEVADDEEVASTELFDAETTTEVVGADGVALTELVDTETAAVAVHKRKRVSDAVTTAEVMDAERVASREVLNSEMVANEQMEEKQQLTGKMRKRAILAVQALDKYYGDHEYCFLFDQIAQFFADLLKSDLQHKNLGDNSKISLAAKWCPTPGLSFDRSTLLCEGIARHLFPFNSNTEYEGMTEKEYSYRVLNRLRHEVLVPLRQLLELPEVYMSANKWSDLPYDRVASVAMRRYQYLFKKHDEVRFQSFLQKQKNKRSLDEREAGKAFLPHKISSMCSHGEGDDSELQWSIMKRNLSEKALMALNNCIAICDMSSSMKGLPMDVCTSLTVLISELSEAPWAGNVFTFSEIPEIHSVTGKTLLEKLDFLQSLPIHTGSRINFKHVFNIILKMAQEFNIPKDKMIKTVFVFSDKEFDNALVNPWLKDYRVACHKFQNAGYHNVVPQVVFWNLRGPRALTSTNDGMMKLKGFSNNLLKLFLEYGGVVHAKDEMSSAIAGEVYKNLKLFD